MRNQAKDKITKNSAVSHGVVLAKMRRFLCLGTSLFLFLVDTEPVVRRFSKGGLKSL